MTDHALAGMLQGFRARPERTRRIAVDSIAAATQGISADVSGPWLEEFVRYQGACGCGLGAACALLGFVAATIWRATRFQHLAVGALALDVLQVLALTAFGAVVGKLVGLARARARFQRATEILIGRI